MKKSHEVFSKITAKARDFAPVPTAVVFPMSDVALKGAVEAAEQGMIRPFVVGPRQQLVDLAAGLSLDISNCEIVDAESDLHAATVGVALCRNGTVKVLMKGSLHTDHLMHAVLDDATGLKTHRRVSHVFVFDIPSYPRMLLITDAAVNIYPTLLDKMDIVQNAIDLAHVLGVSLPKVAILSAVETVTPRIASTIDAAALCKMADRGQITGGVLDGPLAFDNAVSLEAVRIKHIKSPVAGNADILVAPDLEAGNMLAKQLEYLAGSEAAGIVLGARVPIVLTSRADSDHTRLTSCAVAVLLAHHRLRSGDGALISKARHD